MKLTKLQNMDVDTKYLKLYKATYKNTEDNEKVYELISRSDSLTTSNFGAHSHIDAIGMIMFNKERSKILLQKEFRLACNNWVYNFPGGLVNCGESIESAIERELWEETGLHIVDIDSISGPAYTAIGITDEQVITVIGTVDGNLRSDGYHSADEEIIPDFYSKEEVKKLLMDKEPIALRTQSVLYMWAFSNIVLNINSNKKYGF